ncbi:MAG: M6 family metalloprotease domain-containing protein [Dysgonamonadaceae bacterium]|jgi:M6 family metalloprotease-like protein|nr:M6 family metalloprotease domain-containing protein [Dysgonamonadaceae bacterium]
MAKKITLFLLADILLILTQSVLAVPAVPWPVEKIQPDGSKISVYLRGDEKVHWMESLDGYTLVYDANKYVVYAEQDSDANLVPSNNRYSLLSAAPSGLKKGILYSPSQIKMLEQIWQVAESASIQRAGTPSGPRKALCVLMGFSDKNFSKTKSEFETLFNTVGLYPSDGSAKGSVHDFFWENSYGKMDFTVTVVGPYTASNTRKYYATHQQAFAAEAARAADNEIDFNDFADNGQLETFHILFAGYGDESINNGNQIWSHKWQMVSPITLDGVRISVYSCSPELQGGSGSTTTHIGVICHELTHVFGAPDYYDTNTDDGSNYVGAGQWDLMAGGNWNDGGRQPAHINMFQKILFGWVTPTELTSYTEVTAMPPSAQQPVAYSIQANADGELYVLENRQQTGFDTSLPGHGLLIWHVHPKALGGDGSNVGHPQQMYPVVASSSYAIPTESKASYGNIDSNGTPFPGSSGKHAFSARTTPAMFTWNGLQTISKPLTEITESGKTVSFKFMDGPVTPVSNLQAEVTGENVKLIWTAPDLPDVQGYKIYRDNVLQYTIYNGTTTSYTQTGVSNGTYNYGVSAFYEASESETVTIAVAVTEGSDTYMLPVQNLQGSATLDKAYLNWTAPFNGGWMTIAGSGSVAYGFKEEFTFFAGTLWGPEHLKGLDGYEATQIQFYLYETAAAATHTVQIWEVDDNGIPQLKRSQAYTDTRSQGLKTVTLATPLALDVSKEYLIGVEIHTVGGNCFVVDANPIVPLRNWFCEEGEWFPMEYSEFENNFVTSVYLNSGNPSLSSAVLDSRTQQTAGNNLNTLAQKAKTSPEKRSHLNAVRSEKIEAGPSQVAPVLTKYVIYRDGNVIGETSSTSFEDNGLTSGTTYSYCVSAVYNNDKVSESVCAELTTQTPVNPYKPAENYQAVLTDNKVTLQWIAPFTGGQIGYSSSKAALSYNLTGIMAVRFTGNDLKKLLGLQLSRVDFAIPSVTTANTAYTLRIYEGSKGDEPDRIIHEQAISSFQSNSLHSVTLSTPVDINVYEDLWITIVVTSKKIGDIYRMACDAGPAVEGKGNVLFYNKQWTTLPNVGGGSYNWVILGYVQLAGASGAPVVLSHNQASGLDLAASPEKSAPQVYTVPQDYLISRNGVEIATVENTVFTYDDFLSTNGKYVYGVTARYADGNVSDVQTAEILFDKQTGIAAPSVASALKAYPNPVKSGQEFYVKTESPDVTLRIFSLSGVLLKQQPATGLETKMSLTLPAGIYILSAGEEKIKIAVQ